MIRKIRILTILLAACPLLHPSVATGFTPDQVIPFKQTLNSTGGEVTLNLHVFTPDDHDPADRRPAMVFFFGGGWVNSNITQFYPHCGYLASRGMVAIAAEYRVKNLHGTTPQEAVKDGKSAVRYLRENAASLGIDPDRIIAGGGSAGGHVAAAAGTLSAYEESGENLAISSRPDALVLFNPVYDNGPGGYGHNTVSDYWEEISPLHNISATTPPAIVFFGTDDVHVPVATAKNFKALMEAEGVRSDLHLYQEQAHGFFNFAPSSSGEIRYGYRATVFAMDEFLVSLGHLDDPHEAPTPVSGWTTISGDAGFSGGSESPASPVTTGASADAIAAGIDPLALDDGDFLRLTGTVTLDAPLTGGGFRIGLFHGDDPVTPGVGTGYAGIRAEAPATADTEISAGDGSGSDHPFESAAGTPLGPIPGAAATLPADTPLEFSLMIARNGGNLDIAVRFTDGSGSHHAAQNLLNQPLAKYEYNRVAFLMTDGLNASQAAFSQITTATGRVLADTHEPPPPPSAGQITYVDAVAGPGGNTFATGGSQGDTSWIANTDGSSSDTGWSNRALADYNGDTIFQALPDGSAEDIPELTARISGLADGTYEIWTFYWDQVVSTSQNWSIATGLTSGDLATYSSPGQPAVPGATTANVTNAAELTFANSVNLIRNDDRNAMFGVYLGHVTVSGGSDIDVFVDMRIDGASGTSRTMYDGVGYAWVTGPVTGWVDRDAPGSTMVLGNAGTDSPTMGDGSPGNAARKSIYAAIPEVSLDEVGQKATLTGSATLVGVDSSANGFRIGLFDTGGSSDNNGWLGYIHTAGADTTGGGLWKRLVADTTYFSTASGSASQLQSSAAPGTALNDGTYDFLLSITRVADGMRIDAHIIRAADSVVFASNSVLDSTIPTSTFNRISFLSTSQLQADQIQFSDITLTLTDAPPPPPPPPFERLGPPLLAIDFNRNDFFGAPSQALFRIVGGSATQADNMASYTKSFGPRQVTVTQPDGVKFEFRGGNGDDNRAIPGGETSLSFLASDFIATRSGAIDLEIDNLAAGDYIFRSWHLDSLTTGPLGFAQGASPTTPNTIEARIGGELMGSVQGTSLGSSGIGTTFISDTQIPRLEFEFTHDGGSPLVVELRSTESDGADNFLLLNGFALYLQNP